MIHTLLRTAFVGSVAVLILAACQQGPGGTAKPDPHDHPHDHEPPTVKTHNLTIQARDFTVSSVSTFTSLASATYTVPSITAADAQRGIVQVDIQIPGDTVWAPLPYSLHIGLTQYSVSVTLTYSFGAGKMHLVANGDMTTAQMAGALTIVHGAKVRVRVLPTSL